MKLIGLIHFHTKFLKFLWIQSFFFGWAKNLIIASFWFFSNDTTVDAFDTFVCKNGAGNHILGAVFVELETIVIYKVYRDLLAAFQSWVT